VTLKHSKFVAHGFVWIAAPIDVEPVLPLVPIKDLGDWIHKVRIFLLGGRKIQIDRAPEVASDDAVFGDADDRLFTIHGRIKRFADVDVKPSLHLFLFRRLRLDDFAPQGHLEQRSHSLLWLFT
jgi:hypothetical protein